MSRVLVQDQSRWRVLSTSKVGLVFVVTLFWVFLSLASAQSQDTTPPTLTDFSFTPTTIDTSSGQTVVTVNLSAIDDLSGVTYVEAAFSSSSGQTRGASATLSPALSVSATFDVTFPQFSEAGIWTVNRINLSDALSNPRVIFSTELAQLGFPTELCASGEHA